MVKFEVEHRYMIKPEDGAEVLEGEALLKHFAQTCTMSTDFYVVGNDRNGTDATINFVGDRNGKYARDTSVRPRPETVPAVIRSLLGSEGFGFDESMTYDTIAHKGEANVTLRAASLRKKFSAKTEFSIKTGDEPGEIVYHLMYENSCTIFMIGGKVEKAIAKNIEERGPSIAQFTQAWLDDKDQFLKKEDQAADAAVKPPTPSRRGSISATLATNARKLSTLGTSFGAGLGRRLSSLSMPRKEKAPDRSTVVASM